MSYCSHDPAACLSRIDADGNLEYIHFEEGMLSRRKKSYHFPLRSIAKCLDHFGIEIGDVDRIVLDSMNQKTAHNTAPYYRKLIGDYLRAGFNVREDQILFAESHHLAHAYTAFYPSRFSEAAVLSIDGLGSEQDTHSIYTASREGGIRKIYSQKGFGIGVLYALITDRLGFEEGEEGKTMGLAPYGAGHGAIDVSLPCLQGEFKGFFTDYSRIVQRQPTCSLKVKIKKCPSKKEVYSPFYARLAYNVQHELERCLLHLASEIRSRTGLKNLCIAGGVGLNCVANEVIRESGIFDDVYVQPASGDSGISLGLSLAGIYDLTHKTNNKWTQSSKYFWTYSPLEHDARELLPILDAQRVPFQEADVPQIAKLLEQKKIVAYYEKGWEFGPRALGHRSFLADPRHSDMKEILNLKIKHREAYRPFAPIMLQEKFGEYFESKSTDHTHMLFAVKCKEKAKKEVPAIVHVDDTARVQTCTPQAGRIYDILKEFYKNTNVPILVNTSLNDNDEPIVMTPTDALSCFLRTNADVLVVDEIMIRREDIPNQEELLAASTKIQLESQQALFAKALKSLITPAHQQESLKTFLARELLSSLYAKHNESCDRLVQTLFVNRNSEDQKNIVTDAYHLELLKTLAAYYKKDLTSYNIQILEDEVESLTAIPRDAFVLLYNLTVHLGDSEVRAQYPHLASCKCFYRIQDKKAALLKQNGLAEDQMALMANSYEVNPTLLIADFFKEQVVPEFKKLFLE